RLLHAVEQLDGLPTAEFLVAVGDDARQILAGKGQIVERHARIEDVVEDHAADSCVNQAVWLTRNLLEALAAVGPRHFPYDPLVDWQPDLNAGMHANLALCVGKEDLGRSGESHAVAR